MSRLIIQPLVRRNGPHPARPGRCSLSYLLFIRRPSAPTPLGRDIAVPSPDSVMVGLIRGLGAGGPRTAGPDGWRLHDLVGCRDSARWWVYSVANGDPD